MSSPYKRFRVMVLGYKAADMTGLIKVYSGGKHTDPNQTIWSGVVEVAGQNADVDFIDTTKADNDNLSRDRLPLYIGTKVIILVYSVADPSTFKNLDSLLAEFDKSTEKASVPMLLVANHAEARKDNQIISKFKANGISLPSREDGLALMEKESSIIGYYEVSNNDAKMINRIFVDAVYAHLAPARLPGELEVTIIKGQSLVAKDVGGKSDPYVRFGFVNKDGKFIKALSTKTHIVKNNLNPTFTKDNNHRFCPSKSEHYEEVSRLKIECWDYDTIGSDDFMGEAFVRLGDLSDYDGHDLDLVMKSRKDKTDRVDGSITIRLQYHPSSKQ